MTMRTTMLPMFCAALMLGCAQAEEYADTTEADREAIDQVRAQEIDAINSGETSMAYLADGFIALPPNEPALMGADAMREWMEGLQAEFEVSASYPSTNVVISGDVAVEHYTGELTMTPVGGGDAIEETFKGIHVYQRQADGSWKMTHDIWNMDSAPPME